MGHAEYAAALGMRCISGAIAAKNPATQWAGDRCFIRVPARSIKEKPGASVAHVYRRHGIAISLFFRWRAEFGLTARKALQLAIVKTPLTLFQAFSRLSAARLRNWMCREVSSAIMPDCTNCVKVRDTVSIVNPR
jgi:hypothetical protein